MLWTIIVVLLILWLLGFSLHVAGGLIHLLLVVALMVLVINGERPQCGVNLEAGNIGASLRNGSLVETLSSPASPQNRTFPFRMLRQTFGEKGVSSSSTASCEVFARLYPTPARDLPGRRRCGV